MINRAFAVVLWLGVMLTGTAQAQGIQNRQMLEAESARALKLRQEGKPGEALPIAQRAATAAEKLLGAEAPETVYYLNQLALVYQDLSQYAQAEPLFRRSLRILEAQGGKDRPETAFVLNNLAELYKAMGRFEQAEPLYQRSLQILEDKLGKDHPSVATILDNLGNLYWISGQYTRAEPLYRRSLRIFEAKLGENHPEVATSLNNLALLYQTIGQLDQAEPLLQRCIRIRQSQLSQNHPLVATTLSNLAVLFAAKGETTRAADCAERARRIVHRYILRVLPALSETEQADFLENNDVGHWYIALSLGLQQSGDATLAERSAAWLINSKGLNQQARSQSVLLARDRRDPRLHDLSVKLQQKRQELARLTLSPPQDWSIPQRQRRLDELNQQEQDLARQLYQVGGAGGEVPWIELETLRRALSPDSVLIQLARFDVFDFKALKDQNRWQPARYVAWIIPATGPVRLVNLGPADAIDKDVRRVREALQDAPRTIRLKGEADAEVAVRGPLQELTQKVLQPLLPHIGKAKRWVISPDGNLWLVPWAALLLPDGKYAVEDHIISYSVNGRDLVDRGPAQVTPTSPLVLADPDFNLALDQVAAETRRLLLRQQEAPAETRGLSKELRLGGVKRLPGTATEAEAIAAKLRQYAGAAPRVYMDKEATTGVFQAARNPKVIVLSTHGYFLADQEGQFKKREGPGVAAGQPHGLRLENPLLRCGLLLAGCNNAEKAKAGDDNGVLTGLQIAGTDLRGCELVVLSACETGLGEVRNGQGVAGLRQAFQLAGAQSVVATLWQVPDQQTAQLMIGFFNHLAQQPEKGEALRQAQVTLIKARRDRTAAAHHYYWAAFTLTGR